MILVLVLSATVLVLERIVMAEPTSDHERLDVFPRIESNRIEYEYEYRDAEYEYDSAAEI